VPKKPPKRYPERIVRCDYCNKPAQFVTGTYIYPHRPDLAGKTFWCCDPCKAWVGCHAGTNEPLGRLANAKLRKAKSAAHAVFDPLWKRKAARDGLTFQQARTRAYEWLALEMSLPPEECHIGMFDEQQCRRVIEICEPFSRRAA